MGKLTFVGLGLYDEKDISVKGLEAAGEADTVYLEFYTSNLAGCKIEDIESQLGKKVKILCREEVENEAVPINEAKDKKVVLLTAGDPMAATTHVDLRLRAEKEGIETKIIHSSSIFSAVPSQLGLQHYKFGRTVTLPFTRKEKDYPPSPYQNIKENKERGLHTLVLLDIDSKDERYMNVDEGIEALINLEKRLEQDVIKEDTLIAGLARVGSKNPEIRADYPDELRSHDFEGGLHSLVVFGDLHFMEIDSLITLANAPEDIKEEK
ncbi:MAG: diphthine synthase [Candidatus Thermoplasmatota archaeon]|nr:diphthine synthase [Candidatus Thermoplasmatota archaeon]MBS3789505.1 diphthine synthase [Candidatus Thermoplasmatota archaeon]